MAAFTGKKNSIIYELSNDRTKTYTKEIRSRMTNQTYMTETTRSLLGAKQGKNEYESDSSLKRTMITGCLPPRARNRQLTRQLADDLCSVVNGHTTPGEMKMEMKMTIKN